MLKTTPINFGFRIQKRLVRAAFGICLTLITGCSSPTTPAETLPSAASSIPAFTATFSSNEPDREISFTVVGIKPDQTLPLYQEPALDSQVRASLPPAATGVHPLKGDQYLAGENWTAVHYQDLQGWAQTSFLALQQGTLPGELAVMGQLVTSALQTADYSLLKDLIHPQLCLRFAPYQYLRETDQVFCPEELMAAQESDAVRVWGNYDGSGEPIQLTFQAYHERFVYDKDFFQPEVVGFDQEVSQGNSINNIPDIYPDGIMVEYYFPGFDPQYGGMDWRSLRLVFVSLEGRWYLAAVVHGEWTI